MFHLPFNELTSTVHAGENAEFRKNCTLRLAAGDKTVVVPMGEVHKTHRRAFFSGPAVLADACVFHKQGKDVAVVCNQAASGKAGGDLLDNFFHLIVFQPLVDDLELRPQNLQDHHLGEALTEAVARMLLAVEIDDLPLQAIKLVEERLLNVVAFVEFKVLGCFI